MRADALLLAPGAGTDSRHPTLVAIEEALRPLPVARMDFAYRRAGRRPPDRMPRLLEVLREEAGALVAAAGIAPGRLALGGRSLGGRVASIAVAEGLPASALVLVSYPLHPPKRPDDLRTAHFPQIEVPCLFVHGSRDPFGTPEELRAHAEAIPGGADHVVIEGGRHELAGHDAAIAAAVAAWLRA